MSGLTPRQSGLMSRLLVAECVGAIRAHRGMSQGEVAGRLGISQSQLSRAERGHSALTVDQLGALAEIFDVSLQDFFAPHRWLVDAGGLAR